MICVFISMGYVILLKYMTSTESQYSSKDMRIARTTTWVYCVHIILTPISHISYTHLPCNQAGFLS